MSGTAQLIGAELVASAAHRMQAAADDMNNAAGRIEYGMQQRRQWEEEYLARLEALATTERAAVVAFVRGCREDDTDRPRVQVFDVLARQIEQGKHRV